MTERHLRAPHLRPPHLRTRSRLLSGAALVGLAIHPALAAPVATTQYGKVTGTTAQAMDEFLGLRYAAPPTGALRWQPPQPVPESLATRTAKTFAPHCAQLASAYGQPSTSEDCLYLNVYAPQGTAGSNTAKLPVQVWIHGGALLVGESDDYDPVRLVTTGNVIVVTINYRLGYFGYFATSGLDAEGHVAANYGLQDQQFALDWVRRNIAGFGGDPSRVTISGESAGGLSVLSNLVSPTAYGLFNRAIVESGAYALTLPTLSQAEEAGASVAGALGCQPTDTACLRAASTQDILNQQTNVASTVTIVDGTTLPLSINTALKSGKFNRVPVLNGSNHDEYRLFLAGEAGLTAQQYPYVLASLYGATLASSVERLYPASGYARPVYALAAVITDQTFACTARQVDRWTQRYVPTYAYEFNDENAPEGFQPPIPGYDFAAAHASEIQFLFDVPKLPGTPALTPAETRLSDTMVKYWTNFDRQASPDGRGAPYWSPYSPGADLFQSLQPPKPVPESDFSQVHHCTFWKRLINPS